MEKCTVFAHNAEHIAEVYLFTVGFCRYVEDHFPVGVRKKQAFVGFESVYLFGYRNVDLCGNGFLFILCGYAYIAVAVLVSDKEKLAVDDFHASESFVNGYADIFFGGGKINFFAEKVRNFKRYREFCARKRKRVGDFGSERVKILCLFNVNKCGKRIRHLAFGIVGRLVQKGCGFITEKHERARTAAVKIEYVRRALCRHNARKVGEVQSV